MSCRSASRRLATDRLRAAGGIVVDLRVEHALRDELLKAKAKFHAKAASGLVSNVRTGEIVAMVSVPDFDHQQPERGPRSRIAINRLTTGVYEMDRPSRPSRCDGAGFRQGRSHSMWDARGPLHYGKFTIHDDHALGRMINMREVFTYSSNVGAARIALVAGCRGAQGVPAQNGTARSAAHRIARERLTDRAEALGRTEHRHHRVRPWTVGGAIAGGDGDRRAGQRRLSDSADLPQAHRAGSHGGRQAGDQARDLRQDADS